MNQQKRKKKEANGFCPFHWLPPGPRKKRGGVHERETLPYSAKERKGEGKTRTQSPLIVTVEYRGGNRLGKGGGRGEKEHPL